MTGSVVRVLGATFMSC